jgi:hypothetical protein
MLQKRPEFIHQYVRLLGVAASLCAVLVVAFSLRFRASMFLRLESMSTLEITFFAVYLVLFLLFLCVAIGLLGHYPWVHDTMMLTSALGSLILLAILGFGVYRGSVLGGIEYLVETAVAPVAPVVAVEVMMLLLLFIILFNPYNFYLFSRNSTVQSLFVPPQKEATVLKRKEL